MRRMALLALGILCGALAVSGQEEGSGDALAREIDRVKKLIEERIGQAPARADGPLVLRSYDVSDLCTLVGDGRQPLGNLVPSKYDPPSEREIEEPQAAKKDKPTDELSAADGLRHVAQLRQELARRFEALADRELGQADPGDAA